MTQFSVVITIDSIDVSASVIKTVRVSGSEGQARLASFSINPAGGNIDPYSYIGKPVTIDYDDSATVDRLFTGIIHLPRYDITTGLLSFVCTDSLQESVELISRSAVDALLPGYWHEAVFNEPEENWTYAQQIMSTYPGSFDKDVNGATRTTDWIPKVTQDYTFTDSTILHDTLSVSLLERRSITNSIKISFSNRYQRQWQREILGSWNLGIAWGEQLANPVQLPTKAMIESAASGWTEKSITYTNLPESGLYISIEHPLGINWVLSEYAQSQCQGTIITLAKRWLQNATDNYTITIASAASVAQHGLLEVEQKHTLSAESDPEFINFDEYKTPVGTEIETRNWLNLDVDAPDSALDTAMNLAKTRILSSHRQNKVSFQCALSPALDMDKTVRVNHTKAQAKGKISSLVHEIDLLNGSAITTCTLAVYLPNIASQTDDTLATPTSPHTDPAGLTNTLPSMTNHIGNQDGAPVDDPNWNGWITNYAVWTGTPPPTPEYYDTRFSFEIAEAAETDAIEFNGSTSYNVAIPENELVIIK